MFLQQTYESPWMQRLRGCLSWSRWLALGLVLGALVDVAVRVVVG